MGSFGEEISRGEHCNLPHGFWESPFLNHTPYAALILQLSCQEQTNSQIWESSESSQLLSHCHAPSTNNIIYFQKAFFFLRHQQLHGSHICRPIHSPKTHSNFYWSLQCPMAWSHTYTSMNTSVSQFLYAEHLLLIFRADISWQPPWGKECLMKMFLIESIQWSVQNFLLTYICYVVTLNQGRYS